MKTRTTKRDETSSWIRVALVACMAIGSLGSTGCIGSANASPAPAAPANPARTLVNLTPSNNAGSNQTNRQSIIPPLPIRNSSTNAGTGDAGSNGNTTFPTQDGGNGTGRVQPNSSSTDCLDVYSGCN